ncbi:MAG: hypothetical protein ACJ71U_07110 [Terriglobales bacterium]
MEDASCGDDLVAGAICGHSGIYQVIHREHRMAHKVLVRAGDQFPPCNQCGDAVRFRLVKLVAESSPTRAKRARKKSAGRS